MYLDYFSLERHPFRITPDTSLFFPGGHQGRGVVLEAMLYAIESGEGILKVVGEVGSGKTMLCRMLEERLPDSTEVVYLANPNLSPDEILYAVAFELKLPVRRDTSKLLVMQQLQNYLLKQHGANRRVLVIIEEAQGMPVDTLEEIRLFSNLETHRDKLMQIILFGQPELDKNLSVKHIRQLRERITHSFHLNPLTTTQVSEYVRFRLGAAGCPCPQLLTPGAEWLLAKASGGLTRRINILVDKALLAAYAGNVLEFTELNSGTAPMIGWRHVYAAIQDSDCISPIFHNLLSPFRMLSAGVVVALMAFTLLMWLESDVIDERYQASVEPGPNNFAAVNTLGNLPEEFLAGNITTELSSNTSEKIESTSGSFENKSAPQVIEDASTLNEEKSEIVDRRLAEVDSGAADTNDKNTIYVSIDQVELIEGAVVTNEQLSNLELNTYSEADQGEKRPASVERNHVQERVIASIDWLKATNRDSYTVQFVSGETGDLEFAESFLRVLEQADLISESYVCMSTDGSNGYWTIKYGNFNGLSLAQEFIDKLPAPIYGYKPFVQNMSSVECNANNIIAALTLE